MDKYPHSFEPSHEGKPHYEVAVRSEHLPLLSHVHRFHAIRLERLDPNMSANHAHAADLLQSAHNDNVVLDGLNISHPNIHKLWVDDLSKSLFQIQDYITYYETEQDPDNQFEAIVLESLRPTEPDIEQLTVIQFSLFYKIEKLSEGQ